MFLRLSISQKWGKNLQKTLTFRGDNSSIFVKIQKKRKHGCQVQKFLIAQKAKSSLKY